VPLRIAKAVAGVGFRVLGLIFVSAMVLFCDPISWVSSLMTGDPSMLNEAWRVVPACVGMAAGCRVFHWGTICLRRG